MDFLGIKQEAAGRCGEIIAALTDLSADVVEKGRRDHPCPKCDGKTVIWPNTRGGGAQQTGSIACRNCTDNKPTGDVIDTVRVFGGHASQGEAARVIAELLLSLPERQEEENADGVTGQATPPANVDDLTSSRETDSGRPSEC